MFKHIRNFKSYKRKLWNKSINDLTVEENKLIDLRNEIDEKLELISDIIRTKENERTKPNTIKEVVCPTCKTIHTFILYPDFVPTHDLTYICESCLNKYTVELV